MHLQDVQPLEKACQEHHQETFICVSSHLADNVSGYVARVNKTYSNELLPCDEGASPSSSGQDKSCRTVPTVAPLQRGEDRERNHFTPFWGVGGGRAGSSSCGGGRLEVWAPYSTGLMGDPQQHWEVLPGHGHHLRGRRQEVPQQEGGTKPPQLGPGARSPPAGAGT